MKPSQILARLCKDAKIDLPHYSNGKVKIGKKTFHVESCDDSSDWIFAKGKLPLTSCNRCIVLLERQVIWSDFSLSHVNFGIEVDSDLKII